jgi:hypothetical protein
MIEKVPRRLLGADTLEPLSPEMKAGVYGEFVRKPR